MLGNLQCKLTDFWVNPEASELHKMPITICQDLEYEKESIRGLLSRKFLSHKHQLEMTFLHSWELVLLKFSSNTYLYKSNDMYQQIWQHEGILLKRKSCHFQLTGIIAQKRL